MNRILPTPESADLSGPGNGRRSFIRKTGAALSALAATAAAGFSRTGSDTENGLEDQIGRLSRMVGNLEDAEKIRRLHQSYESRLDRGMYEDVVAMFTEDAEVIYNGGLFRGKNGVRRLYCHHFAAGHTGKRVYPTPEFEPDQAGQMEVVEVAGDRVTASGRFPYSIQAGRPMAGDSSLVAMARLQGEGIMKWWEGGSCEVSYVKAGDTWMVRRLEYRASSITDYRPGRTCAAPIDVPAFTGIFPGNPTGPDQLV
jgi:hypothetical protein